MKDRSQERDRSNTALAKRHSTGDRLAVYCWCAKHIVIIPRSWVGRGTRSCGADGCHRPEDTAA